MKKVSNIILILMYLDKDDEKSDINLNLNSLQLQLQSNENKGLRMLQLKSNEKNNMVVIHTNNTNKSLQNNNINLSKDDNSEYEDFCKAGGMVGEVISDRGSSFQAHAIVINNMNDFDRHNKNILSNSKIKKATHNIMAYRVKVEDKDKDKDKEKDKDSKKGKKGKKSSEVQITEGFYDDGEDRAGIRLLGLLQKMKIRNILVIVSRWFGGTLLGNDRFKHINDAAKDLINAYKNKFVYSD